MNGDTNLDGGDNNKKALSLLIVISQTFSKEQKEQILNKINSSLIHIDYPSTINIEEELNLIIKAYPHESYNFDQEFRISAQKANFEIDVLINSTLNSFKRVLRSFLKSDCKTKCFICAGIDQNSTANLVFQDSLFSSDDFLSLLNENEINKSLKESSDSFLNLNFNSKFINENANLKNNKNIKLNGEAAAAGSTTAENDGAVDTEKANLFKNFMNYLESFLNEKSIVELMDETKSKVVGTLNVEKPSLYIFPAKEGDCSFFTFNGYSILVNGGYDRISPCFWRFASILKQIDSVMITHLDADALGGLSSFFSKKTLQPDTKPDIFNLFANLTTKQQTNEPNLLNDVDIINEAVNKLKINVQPLVKHDLKQHGSQQKPEHVNLYHKYGYGSLDMYVLSPFANSQEYKEFLAQAHGKVQSNTHKSYLSVNQTFKNIPIAHLCSAVVLLAWTPAKVNENAIRILYTGNAPQNVVFHALEKIKDFDLIQLPVHKTKAQSHVETHVISHSKKLSNTTNVVTKIGNNEVKSSKSTTTTTSTTTTAASSTITSIPPSSATTSTTTTTTTTTTAASVAATNGAKPVQNGASKESNVIKKPSNASKVVTNGVAKKDAHSTITDSAAASSAPTTTEIKKVEKKVDEKDLKKTTLPPVQSKPPKKDDSKAKHESSAQAKPASTVNASKSEHNTKSTASAPVKSRLSTNKPSTTSTTAAAPPAKPVDNKDSKQTKDESLAHKRPSATLKSTNHSEVKKDVKKETTKSNAKSKPAEHAGTSMPRPIVKPEAPKPVESRIDSAPVSVSGVEPAVAVETTFVEKASNLMHKFMDAVSDQVHIFDTKVEEKTSTPVSPGTPKASPSTAELLAEQFNNQANVDSVVEVLTSAAAISEATVTSTTAEEDKTPSIEEGEIVETVENNVYMGNGHQNEYNGHQYNDNIHQHEDNGHQNEYNEFVGHQNEYNDHHNENNGHLDANEQPNDTEEVRNEESESNSQFDLDANEVEAQFESELKALHPIEHKNDENCEQEVQEQEEPEHYINQDLDDDKQAETHVEFVPDELIDEMTDESEESQNLSSVKQDQSDNSFLINENESDKPAEYEIEQINKEKLELHLNEAPQACVVSYANELIQTPNDISPLEERLPSANVDLMTASFNEKRDNEANLFVTKHDYRPVQDNDELNVSIDEDSSSENLNEPAELDTIISGFQTFNIDEKKSEIAQNQEAQNGNGDLSDRGDSNGHANSNDHHSEKEKSNIDLLGEQIAETNFKVEESLIKHSLPETWNLLQLPKPVNPTEQPSASTLTSAAEKKLATTSQTSKLNTHSPKSNKEKQQSNGKTSVLNTSIQKVSSTANATVSSTRSNTKPINPYYFEVSYIPAHGNQFYVDSEYFKRVRARFYILSTVETTPHILNSLMQGKETWEDKNLQVSIIPTYESDILRHWFMMNEEALARLKIDVLPSANLSTLTIDDNAEFSCPVYKLEF